MTGKRNHIALITLLALVIPVLGIGMAFGSVNLPLGFTLRTLFDALAG